ncbi:MAG: ABC transporter ATP-binding protein [Bacillota bacterium]|jgi:ATP-binding cassette subfamily B protein|nr:ABC transporter ATP-binding protein [Bacillota bacterium]HHU29873.1 ABC transporter ATP-binding protein [Bacillota bacterium]
MARLLHYLKPYRFLVVASLAMVVIRAVIDLYLPQLTADIIDIGVVNADIPFILRVGALMLAVAAAGGACNLLGSYFAARASAGYARDLRKVVFAHVESFSLQEFDKFGTASLITRTTNDVQQLQMFVMMGMRMMVMTPIMSVGGIVMAVSKDPGLSLIFLIAVPILFVMVTFIARKGTPMFRSMQKKLDRINLVMRERLTGIRVIRAFNRDEYEKKRFEEANLDFMQTAIRIFRIMAVMMPVMMMVMNLTTVSIIWFGGIRIDRGHMMVGDLMAFIQYGMHIMFSMFSLSMLFVTIPRAAASLARVDEVLDTKPSIKDPENPVKPGDKRGYVEFRDVTFSYPGAERPALSNITFSAGPGEVTAIIGGTGSGKSTLSSLLLRFYDVQSGSILVDGIDIREITQKELRAKIGYAPQRAVLFSGSVDDNIRYGKKDATIEEVRHAAEIAQAKDFVEKMPEQYDAEISQRGTNISGGQKQRLSIARALVGRPEIYIFDDTFSALDFKTDARLRAALKNETADATVIIVAQRVNTVMDADRIIVLEDGRIAGIGTHEELLKDNEIYREIVFSQLSEEEIA